MPSFERYEEEIEFGLINFDYVEITILPQFKLEKNSKYVGHLHWEDTLEDSNVLEEYKRIGCKWITIHPRNKLNIEENVKRIKEFVNRGIDVYVENIKGMNFRDIMEIVNESGVQGITLDVGHTLMNKEEVKKYLETGKVKHVHLHNSIEGVDHVPFESESELKEWVNLIKENYNGTICYEIFRDMEGKKLNINNKRKILEKIKLV
ncbi:MAG: sugar phosphate isomerase/epimerase [Bacteroidales bacterium]|jgi:sugar phosphate isomerase/epimerase|nr:sugar phosphate isomerase/epimerase [Bacteroidales bacterium]